MCTVWHVDKYKITVKFQENLTRPGIIEARARYRAAARRLRNTALDSSTAYSSDIPSNSMFPCKSTQLSF